MQLRLSTTDRSDATLARASTNGSRPTLPMAADPVTDAILRTGTGLGLAGVALIHFLDLFSKLKETPYLGGAYLVLIGASLILGGRLIRAAGPRLWAMAGGLSTAAVIGYVLSRSVGLPNASNDIGNWTEPLGLAALFLEGIVVMLSTYALMLSSPSAGRTRR